MIILQWEEMTEYETGFVNDLIYASVLDIVRPDEVDRSIEEVIFTDCHDVYTVYNNVMKILSHIYNGKSLLRKPTVHFDAEKLTI